MLIPEPRSAPLADGSEDVLGLSLVRLMRARLVMIRHVGPGAGLVQLEQGNRMEEAPRRFPGRVLGMSGAVGVVRGLWPEARVYRERLKPYSKVVRLYHRARIARTTSTTRQRSTM